MQSKIVAIVIGSIIVFFSAQFGSTLCLILGRFAFRKALFQKAKQYKLFMALDKAVETEVNPSKIIYI
jgi:uncharacterized membrane protein YdjX (TVP38/TMEM64 family)